MMDKVTELIKRKKLIVIIRGVTGADLIPLCEALYDGGVRLVEITFSSDGLKDESVARDVRIIAEHFADKLIVGAGTVVTEKQVALTRAAGGKFIISPNVSESIIKATKNAGLISIPGALTPTEIWNAYSFGADFVKLFPAGERGIGYIKAIRAPLSHIPLLAVGGIDLNNSAEYLNAGISGVGIGSSIVRMDCIKQKDFSTIRRLASEYVALIESNEAEE